MEEVVWIGNDGQDNSGASTLGLEFNKILGIKTLFKGTEFSKGEISTYRDLKDLKILLDELKPKIILLYPGSTKKMDKVKDFYELIFSYQLNTKIILIDCSRYGYLLGRNSEKILEDFGIEKKDSYHITISSFGYKYGVPIDADNIVDVRFLRNPFYINELREKTGQDSEVYDYVFEDEVTQEFYDKYLELMTFMVDKYQYEGRDKVAIAVGCTGGKHRSVSVARKLHEDISKLGYRVYLEHRDINKGR